MKPKIVITRHAIQRYKERIESSQPIRKIKKAIIKELNSPEIKWVEMKNLPKEILIHLSLRGLEGGYIAFNCETGVLYKLHFDRNKRIIVVSVDRVDGALKEGLSDLLKLNFDS